MFPPENFAGPFGTPTPSPTFKPIPTPSPTPSPSPTPTYIPGSNMLNNGDFSAGTNYWSFFINEDDGAIANYSVVSEELYYNITDGKDTGWYVQMMYNNLYIAKNFRYTITFDAKAEANRGFSVELGENNNDNNGDGNPYTSYGYTWINVTTTMTQYEAVVNMMDKSDGTARLVFNLGASNSDVWIDNVSLVRTDLVPPSPLNGVNKVVNGDISAGTAYWNTYYANGANGTLSDDSGALRMDISSLGLSMYDLQIHQRYPGMVLIQGGIHRVNFDAWATANKNIGISLDENGHDLNENNQFWDSYDNRTFSITTTPQQYTYYYTQSLSHYNAGLVFFLGTTTDTVFLDNISIISWAGTDTITGGMDAGSATAMPSLNTWYTDSISGGSRWYSAAINTSSPCRFFINDASQGSGNYPANIALYVYHANGTTLYDSVDIAYYIPLEITPVETTIIIEARPVSGTGSFAFGVEQ
ncbi:MAG: carbohydrate binding domain-containing protein [Spirochaetales bacterium]|nr:carbohydrate binding domain-containing protein [Spirochaetales bacterium]